jgi:hypothetical protein
MYFAEDLILCLVAMLRTNKYAVTTDRLYIYRQRDDGIMCNKEAIKLEKYVKDVHILTDVFYRLVLPELQQRAIAPEAIDYFQKKAIPWVEKFISTRLRLDGA